VSCQHQFEGNIVIMFTESVAADHLSVGSCPVDKGVGVTKVERSAVGCNDVSFDAEGGQELITYVQLRPTIKQ